MIKKICNCWDQVCHHCCSGAFDRVTWSSSPGIVDVHVSVTVLTLFSSSPVFLQQIINLPPVQTTGRFGSGTSCAATRSGSSEVRNYKLTKPVGIKVQTASWREALMGLLVTHIQLRGFLQKTFSCDFYLLSYVTWIIRLVFKQKIKNMNPWRTMNRSCSFKSLLCFCTFTAKHTIFVLSKDKCYHNWAGGRSMESHKGQMSQIYKSKYNEIHQHTVIIQSVQVQWCERLLEI